MATYAVDSSGTQKGFTKKIQELKQESYLENHSVTGYGDKLLGMDDIDKIRRAKLSRQFKDK